MKKRIITIAAALMMATAPAMAQVFIMDEDDYQGNRAAGPGAMIPMQDNPNDQYIPVGEGVFVLAGLAGAYLLGKRRKEK
jgi:uncharacterized protein (DUF39 family)